MQDNLRAAGHTLGREMPERVAQAYGMFPDLNRYRDKKGRVLSGGQRQMLALGMALVCRPRVIRRSCATSSVGCARWPIPASPC